MKIETFRRSVAAKSFNSKFLYPTHALFYAFFFFLSVFSSTLFADDSCGGVARRVLSYIELQQSAENAVRQEQVEVPYWMRVAAPDNASYIAIPARDSAKGEIQKGVGSQFVTMHWDFNYTGRDFHTRIGFSPEALADNIFRFLRREKRSVLPENAIAGVLHNHGGGTLTSDVMTAANTTVQLAKKNVAVLGMDFLSHGAMLRQTPPRSPMDIVRLPLFVVNELFSKGTQTFISGHSEGGEIAGAIQVHMSPAEVAANYPNISFKGLVAISPPMDFSNEGRGGGSLLEKVVGDEEFTDAVVMRQLIDNGNINPRATQFMDMMTFLRSWHNEIMKKENIPMLAQMGAKDNICYPEGVCQIAWKLNMEGRPNTDTILYEDMVDFNGDPVEAGHMIVAHMRPKKDKEIFAPLGEGMPQVYADALTWMMRRLGDKDFDAYRVDAEGQGEKPSYSGSEPPDREKIKKLVEKGMTPADAAAKVEADNQHRTHRDVLTNVLSLFARNLFFREFSKQFEFQRRSPVDPELTAHINLFLNNFGQFVTTVKSFLSAPERQIAHWPEDKIKQRQTWLSFFSIMKESNPDQETFSQVQDALHSMDHAGAKYALNLLSQKFDPTNPSLTLPDGMPFSVDNILQSFQHDTPGAAIAQLEHQFKITLAFRDVNVKVLSEFYPELAAYRDEMARLENDFNSTGIEREKLLEKLVALHAQRYQTHRLLTEQGDKLLEIGISTHEILQSLPELEPEVDLRSCLEAHEKLLALGFKKLAFESFLGPLTRVYYSNIVKHAEARPNLKSAQSLEKNEKAILSNWKALVQEISRIKHKLGPNTLVPETGSTWLKQANDNISLVRDKAFDLLNEFWSVRMNHVKDTEHLWTPEYAPPPPERYFELIDLFEEAQSQLLELRQKFEAEKRQRAIRGEFGSYLKFIYDNLELIEQEIIEKNGVSTNDPGSLTALEDKLQRFVHQREDVARKIIENHMGFLYKTVTVRLWDELNNPDQVPTTEVLSHALAAWYRTWRDTTGGVLSDPSEFR